jgi:hypothetical protein
VPFGQKCQLCGPKCPNVTRISAFDFSKPRNVSSIVPFFSEAVSSRAFSRKKGNRPFELTALRQPVRAFHSPVALRPKLSILCPQRSECYARPGIRFLQTTKHRLNRAVFLRGGVEQCLFTAQRERLVLIDYPPPVSLGTFSLRALWLELSVLPHKWPEPHTDRCLRVLQSVPCIAIDDHLLSDRVWALPGLCHA